MNESLARTIGPINLDEKLLGKRSAGNPHAAFDEAGAGNVTKGVGLRTTAKAPNSPPDPKGKRASSRPYVRPERLVCSAGDKPVRVRVRSPVA